MVVSDVDGTLFDSDQPGYEISRDLQELIKALHTQGKIFTIASGRPLASCQPIAMQLQLNVPYIACNGAVIADRTGNILYSRHFAVNPWRSFFNQVLEIDGTVLLVYQGNSFYLERTGAVATYEKKEKIICRPASEYLDGTDKNLQVNKVLLIGKVIEFLKQWDKLDQNMKATCRYVISEDNYMEIMKAGVSKGAGLRVLKRHLGIGDEEVLSIGNHLNDRELLEEAKIGVAVANAQEGLKRSADYVTRESFHLGVIEIMQRILDDYY